MPETAKKPKTLRGGVGKRRRGRAVQGFRKRRQALKMLAVMEAQEASIEPANAHSAEFLSTGRTGRRNAMPDILGEHAVVSSGDLPSRLQGLTTTDGAGPSTSAGPAAASTSDAGAGKQPDDAS